MAAKIFVVFCVSTVLVQTISSQCIRSPLMAEEYAFGAGPYGAPFGLAAPGFNGIPSSGCSSFVTTSASPIHPTGINVFSENAIEGPVSIAGELPFLGAIALEGTLPTLGAGGINYGCGKGAVGIVSEGIAPAYPAAAVPGRLGYPAPGLVAPGLGAPGLGAPGLGAPGLVAPGLVAPGLVAPGLGAGLGYGIY